jgi:hypothetical protein
LIRLFKRELPKLFGGDDFTKQVLRFAWHLTTIAWFGFASILIGISYAKEELYQTTLYTTAAVFLLSGLMSFGYTKGRHYSYIVFWFIATVCILVAIRGA